MTDELDTLGSLIAEIKHSSLPPGSKPTLALVDPISLLTLSKESSATPSGQIQQRLPADADLAALLNQLKPPTAATAPSVDTVVGNLEAAASGTAAALTAATGDLALMDWPGIWAVINRLASSGPTANGQTYLELLESAVRGLPGVDPKVPAAMLVGRLARGGQTVSTGSLPDWLRLTALLIPLTTVSQLEVLGQLGVPPQAAEGAIAGVFAAAFRVGIDLLGLSGSSGLSTPQGVSQPGLATPHAPAVAAAAPPDLLATLKALAKTVDINGNDFLPCLKPGKTYVMQMGTAVHKIIAEYYWSKHSNHLERNVNFWSNYSSIYKIFKALEKKFNFMGDVMAAALFLERPDILEFTVAHSPKGRVYEIKPADSADVALSEAYSYALAMNLCGREYEDIHPGPMVDPQLGIQVPGTRGTLPAPGGWVVFDAPMNGVIVYQLVEASDEALKKKGQVRVNSALRDQVEQRLSTLAQDVLMAALIGTILAQVVVTLLELAELAAVILGALMVLGWVVD